jgi:hypothetical protein
VRLTPANRNGRSAAGGIAAAQQPKGDERDSLRSDPSRSQGKCGCNSVAACAFVSRPKRTTEQELATCELCCLAWRPLLPPSQ